MSVRKVDAPKLREKFTIRVSPEFPPIPDRSCDYAAWIDGEEETTTVTGPTPALALTELVHRLLDEESSVREEAT